MTQAIRTHWEAVYGTREQARLDDLLTRLEAVAADVAGGYAPKSDWYRDAVVYSLYVDQFAGDFDGLADRLDYLADLGVNTLWLLPILASPMRDQGFDISDYRSVREDLGGNPAFQRFIDRAHAAGLHIVFDLAVSHTSDQHPWFIDAASGKDAPYRDYYIWSDTTERYKDARLLFKGMVPSNWEPNAATGDYYFHRFYEFQPDLNYRNPQVLIEMIDVFLYWMKAGVDGLRMDAIPFIWKEEGTNCEDLPQTHTILKLIRAALDHVRAGTFLIAEANMQPEDVVRYFGEGDECQAAYHFPVMPQFFAAQAMGDAGRIAAVLSPAVTPTPPEGSLWMMFLRCHDELTLEFADPETRAIINEHYCVSPEHAFREGEGVAGRLYSMMRGDVRRVLNIFSMMIATGGAPIFYYGDEVGMEDNLAFFEKISGETGHRDARFINRGPMDWEKAALARKDRASDPAQIYAGLQQLLRHRRDFADAFAGTRLIRGGDQELYAVEWTGRDQQLLILHNLTDKPKEIAGLGNWPSQALAPYGYAWLTGGV